MCRKIAIAVGAVLLGVVIVSSTNVCSLIHVKWNDATAWLDRKVPIETKIKQLRVETDKIDSEIKANLGKLAKLEVETQNLEQNVVALKNEQADRKSEIAMLASDLEKKADQVAKKDLKPLTNKLDLAVSTFEVKDAKLKNLDNLLAAKRQTLEAAHQKISAMKDQRDELRITIAKLETRKELVDIKTQQSTIQFSDSKIADCNRLAKEIGDQLSEREIYADNLRKYGYTDGSPTVEKEGKNVKDVLKSAKKVLNDSQEDQ